MAQDPRWAIDYVFRNDSVLQHGAVHRAFQPEALALIVCCRRHQTWADGAKLIEPFGEEELPTLLFWQLVLTARNVVAEGETEDVSACFVFGDVLAVSGRDENELALVISQSRVRTESLAALTS